MNVALLRMQFGWMGSHSGYDKLVDALPVQTTSVWVGDNSEPQRGLRKVKRFIVNKSSPSPYYNLASYRAEREFISRIEQSDIDCAHMMYVENQLGICATQQSSIPLIGTVHQPPEWWEQHAIDPSILQCFDGLIVLTQHHSSFFEQYLPGKVWTVPHGVDHEFFTPGPSAKWTGSRLRCITVGRHMRDFDLLEQIVYEASNQKQDIEFHIVVPEQWQTLSASLHRLMMHPLVHVHRKVTDLGLVNLYQQSHCLLLPLLDCMACNALLEAMSCGLPIVTTNVGAAPEAVSDSFASCLPKGDLHAMVSTLISLRQTIPDLQEKSHAARSYVMQHYQWQTLATRMVDIYQQVTQKTYV